MKASLLVISGVIGQALANPSYMPCSRELAADVSIMSSDAVSSTDRTIVWKRGSTSLACGDEYTPGETLALSISDSSDRYLFEVSGGASISGGTCSSTRKDSNNLSVTMPSSGTVEAWVGWAGSSTAVVKISSKCALVPAPTQQPTKAPTKAPTPSAAPTDTPTAAPTTEDEKVDGGGSASRTVAANALSGLFLAALSFTLAF
ncbi:hypothetical protein TrLO_g2102 [Triparma laevis f. longispina]|uniref:Uncharacterized protein n=1 Tax=Triparma laevis f. longispina TaxID=1714387 RepID=A0A9W7FL41_9STRA|nr:hypothetical protein TrLO_g2102 [Triparma laevis f. longispina]